MVEVAAVIRLAGEQVALAEEVRVVTHLLAQRLVLQTRVAVVAGVKVVRLLEVRVDQAL
mgnify:CR=1 FL=1